MDQVVHGGLAHLDRSRRLLHRDRALYVRERVRELSLHLGGGERVVRYARGWSRADHDDELVENRLQPRVVVGERVEVLSVDGVADPARVRPKESLSSRTRLESASRRVIAQSVADGGDDFDEDRTVRDRRCRRRCGEERFCDVCDHLPRRLGGPLGSELCVPCEVRRVHLVRHVVVVVVVALVERRRSRGVLVARGVARHESRRCAVVDRGKAVVARVKRARAIACAAPDGDALRVDARHVGGARIRRVRSCASAHVALDGVAQRACVAQNVGVAVVVVIVVGVARARIA